MTSARVSIALVTRNGIETLPRVLDAIGNQHCDATVEVVAVDSASTDGTGELLRQRADRFISIPADTFDHGATRNLAVQETSGELVVMLVQDAVPITNTWLAELIAPLRGDRCVAGTFARQVARSTATPLTRHYASRWLAASEAPRTVRVSDPGTFASLAPAERFDRCIFDNVCSCIRRNVWCLHPYRRTPIGEDVAWAKDVLLDGYALAYTPAAAVEHSHDRPAGYEYRRTFALHAQLYDLFGMQLIPDAPSLARAVASNLVHHLKVEPSWRSLTLAVAWPAAQYLGARSAVRSRAR